MKTCFKCGVIKPLSEFYRHSRMADGHLNKCKVCARLDVSSNREGKIDYYRAYDRSRGNEPNRVDARDKYAKTERGKAALDRSRKAYVDRNPIRRAAHVAVGNALRDGRLVKLPCWVCGCLDVEGHHPHYGLPISVVWLCKAHHQQLHDEHHEYLRSLGAESA